MRLREATAGRATSARPGGLGEFGEQLIRGPRLTLDAFERLPHEKYKFKTIVFEHDCYRASQYGLGIQPSDEFLRSGNYSSENLEWLNHTREVISSYGYKLDAKYSQDDFYILEEE